MKYSMECKIDGLVIIGKQIEIKNGNKKYVFIPNPNGLLSSIRIVLDDVDPSMVRSSIKPGEGKSALTITIDGTRKPYLELQREFQELESLLAFGMDGSLKSIAWDEPSEGLIPENDDEKQYTAVSGFQFSKEYPELPTLLKETDIRGIIETKERYSSLIIPKAFFREGLNEYSSKRYINAFYNFYFIIEDLYGEGKTRNKDIATAFRESNEFRGFLDWVIKNHLDERHRANLSKFCLEEGLNYDIDGLIDLLWHVRGNLHHYSSMSSKHIGTPFSHEAFESIAFLTLGLAVRAILQKILILNQAANTG